MINYWKTVKLDPKKTEEIYGVDIRKLSSKEVKDIRRDLFRFAVLKKYPYLSVNFLTMLWYKHLDFKENPIKFLNEYFSKYSNAMPMVNMLTSGMYLASKLMRGKTVEVIHDRTYENISPKEKTFVSYVMTNHWLHRPVKNTKKIGKEISIRELIDNLNFVDSVVVSNNKRNIVLGIITDKMHNTIKGNINNDVKAKIPELIDKQLFDILNVIENYNPKCTIPEIDKQYEVSDIKLIGKLYDDQKIEKTFSNEYVNLHLTPDNKLLIHFTDENKQNLKKCLADFDFSQLKIPDMIKVLQRIY
jgi:hypothetical protein